MSDAVKNGNVNPKDTEIAFFGGSFTAIEKEKQVELLEAVQEYIENKKVYSIRISTRPDAIDKDARPVSAISPGVLGTTGIETLEILKGIVDNIKPKLIIIIDALASRSMERISSSVQLADTGIVPGAGVGNKRKEITIETVGVPVIAIGIPTVVEAATIAADSLDLFIKKLQEEAKSNEYLNKMQEEDKYEMIKEVLTPSDYNFIVTPKEIDELIENMSSIVARGINFAVQKENI